MTAPSAGSTTSAPFGATPARRTGTGPLGVGGWILAVLAVLVAIGGAGAVVIHVTQRGDDGYYTSSTEQVGSAGYAVTADGLDLSSGAGAGALTDIVGHVRVKAAASGGRPVFVGIARTTDIDRYLGGVAHSRVTDIDNGDVVYAQQRGHAPAGAPGRQGFWEASTVGPGRRTLTWKVHSGNWSVAVLNADARRPVRAAVSVGAKTDLVLWIGLGLLALALVLGGVGTAMVVADGRNRRGRPSG